MPFPGSVLVSRCRARRSKKGSRVRDSMYSLTRREATHYRRLSPLILANAGVLTGGEVRRRRRAIWPHVILLTIEMANLVYGLFAFQDGVAEMTGPSQSRKSFILVVAALSCATLAVSIGVAYPRPVANSALGADWQCHRSAGILTTCHRVSHAAPATHRSIFQLAEMRQA